MEDTGAWPDGLLDAYIAMIPKTDGDAALLGQRPLSVLPVVYRILGLLLGCCSMRICLGLGSRILSLVLGVVSVMLRLGILLLLILKKSSLVLPILMFISLSFDTVDRGVLDRFFE